LQVTRGEAADAFDDAGEHQAAPMGMQQPTSAAKVATQPWT